MALAFALSWLMAAPATAGVEVVCELVLKGLATTEKIPFGTEAQVRLTDEANTLIPVVVLGSRPGDDGPDIYTALDPKTLLHTYGNVTITMDGEPVGSVKERATDLFERLLDPIEQDGPHCVAFSAMACLRLLDTRGQIRNPHVRHQLSHAPEALQKELNQAGRPGRVLRWLTVLRALFTLTPVSKFQADRIRSLLEAKGVRLDPTADFDRLNAHLETGLPAMFLGMVAESTGEFGDARLFWGTSPLKIASATYQPTANGKGTAHAVVVHKYLPGMDVYLVMDPNGGGLALWSRETLRKNVGNSTAILTLNGRLNRKVEPFLLVSPIDEP